MKRLSLVLLLVLPGMFVGPPAWAAGPIIEREPYDDTFTSNRCGFPIEVHIAGTLVRIAWSGEDGSLRRIEAWPELKGQVTNPATGETITRNLAGPSKLEVAPDGSSTFVGTGTWFWGVDPEVLEAAGEFEPGFFWVMARFVFTFDVEGDPSSFSFSGQVVDLCEELAA